MSEFSAAFLSLFDWMPYRRPHVTSPGDVRSPTSFGTRHRHSATMPQNLILTKDFENSECMQQDWHLKFYLPITETLTTKKQLVKCFY